MREIRSPLDGILSPFAAKPTPLSGAATLAAGEAEAFALDFTDSSIFVKDTGTPANNIDQTGLFNAAGEAIGPQSRLTYTNPTPKQVLQADGLLKFGAHNLLLHSDDITQAVWVKTGVTGDDATTLGVNSGVSITTGAVGYFTSSATGFLHQQFTSLNAGAYRIKVKTTKGVELDAIQLRVATNANLSTLVSASSAVLANLDDGTNVAATGTITPDGSGYILECDFTLTAATTVYVGFWLWNSTSRTTDGSETYTVENFQLRRAPSVDTYVKTGASAVYALPIDHDASGNQIGVLVEPQATNLAVYSNDLTQAAWTPTNITPAKTATGPDGVASSSTTLTATAGNATILQSITSASSARVTSCYIKRRTGTGTIEMTQDNGSTWSAVTVTTDWSRVEIAAATITNPVVGLRIITSGDEIDVAYFQHETGSVVTSAIATPANATVTRLVDDITEATSAIPYDATAGTLYAYGAGRRTAAVGVVTSINVFAAFEESSTSSNVLMVSRSGFGITTLENEAVGYIKSGNADQMLAENVGTLANDTFGRMAIAASANNGGFAFDGTAAATDTSVTMPTGINQLTLVNWQGQSAYGVNPTYIKQVMYLPRRVSNTDLQTLTSTGALP